MRTIFEKIKLQIIFFIARRVRDCKNITPLFSKSLDKKLPLWTRFELKLHLFTCQACVRYIQQIKFLRETLQKHAEQIDEEILSDRKLSDAAKEKLKKALQST